MAVLRKGFEDEAFYEPDVSVGYELLPLRFARLEDDTYLLTNLVGELLVLTRPELVQLVHHQCDPHTALYKELKSKHFLLDSGSDVALDLLAAKYRTRLAGLPQLVGLHIFVLTLRCNQSCRYCQVTRRSRDQSGFDMSAETARLATDFMFQSPSRALKVEFQGGEPTLNFTVLKEVVERAESRAITTGRTVEFVLCSNLADVSDEMWAYFRDHRFQISTSLDGPRSLHDAHRIYPGESAFGRVRQAIRRARDLVGPDRVSALMTTTREALSHPREIIDEYLTQGFNSIFLRPLNPYGFATRNETELSYEVDEWLAFFRECLDYIIEINQQGVAFREQYSALVLRRMLTPFGHGYVDLQSPTGSGTGVLVYDYDGAVYPSDESRMLAAMGDHRFRFGQLGTTSFEALVSSEGYRTFVADTMLEGLPMCSECAFQPYCGSDPIRHYRDQGDIVGHKPTSTFCRKQQGMVSHLIRLYTTRPEARAVLARWA